MSIFLRPYQDKAIIMLRDEFKKHRRVILQLATGGGKTACFASLAKRTLDKTNYNRILILTHRKELMTQAGGMLARVGLNPEFVRAGKRSVDFSQRCIVAMVETFNNRVKRDPSFIHKIGQPSLVIVDECHLGGHRKVMELFPDAYILGCTATPVAASKKNPLNQVFDGIVTPIAISDLIEQGWLAHYRHYGVRQDISGLKVSASTGDYTESSQFNFFDNATLYDGVVENYLKMCSGRDGAPKRKTIVFCCNIEHAIKTHEAFVAAGVNACCIHSKMKDEHRDLTVKAYSEGRHDAVVNCGILQMGYDDPTTSCIILNRATRSLPLYQQMIGRASRPHPTKDDFIVIDHGNNAIRLGFWNDEIDWVDMFHKAKEPTTQGVPPMKTCPSCEALVYTSVRECPYCHYIWPVVEKERKATGEFEELRRTEMPEELKTKPWKTMTATELVIYSKAKGYKPGWVLHQIYLRPKIEWVPMIHEMGRAMGYKKGWASFKVRQIAKAEQLTKQEVM